jgi:hypothetical protein
MDAFELLKNDHEKVSQLFKQIESATGDSKRALFTRLKTELDLHAHVEETIFYPALENKEPARDITLEAYEEHQVVKNLLAELATGSTDEEWDAKLTVLKENVEHHVEEEEGEMFSKARDVLSDEQIEAFGTEMEAEKARQRGAAPPGNAPPSSRARAKGPAKATSSKTSKSPGVLKRLANLVGLGQTGSQGQKRAAAKKGRAAGKASKKSSKKTTKSSSKKSGSKTGSRKAAGKKSATTSRRRSAKSSKRAGSKTRGSAATKASKKSGGRKSTKRTRGR